MSPEPAVKCNFADSKSQSRRALERWWAQQQDPLLPGYDTPPTETLGPANDLTSAFIISPVKGVTEIESKCWDATGADGASKVSPEPAVKCNFAVSTALQQDPLLPGYDTPPTETHGPANVLPSRCNAQPRDAYRTSVCTSLCCTHSPTHPLTHSSTHPFTHPPTHPTTHSLARGSESYI